MGKLHNIHTTAIQKVWAPLSSGIRNFAVSINVKFAQFLPDPHGVSFLFFRCNSLVKFWELAADSCGSFQKVVEWVRTDKISNWDLYQNTYKNYIIQIEL